MQTSYFDHAATTPLDPAVLEAMMPYLTEQFGNPSSVHALGRRARFAVEDARERVAAVLGCEPAEVVFTSGGTEADNAAIRGVLGHPDRRGPGFITSPIEHEAVLQPAEALQARDHPVTRLAPGASGVVTVDQVDAAIDERTGLVSLMWVNNETGAVTDIAAIARLCRQRGVLFHSDAVQAATIYPLAVEPLAVDLMTLSAHKFHGPKGAGVLFVRQGTPLRPLMLGGAQERRRRGGTENVGAIVGLAEALERAASRVDAERARLAGLRDRLVRGITDRFGAHVRFNSPESGAPHIVNVSFPPRDGRPVDGEMLLLALDMGGVMASSGSACASGAVEPSHVLRALGIERDSAQATVRLSMGRATDEAAVDHALALLGDVVERARLAATV